MATGIAANSIVKYKVISRHLSKHLVLKLSDGAVSNAVNVCCVHCKILKINYFAKINY